MCYNPNMDQYGYQDGGNMPSGQYYQRMPQRQVNGMADRLTWTEIKTRYPNRWVGLTDVEWKDTSNIKSAVVKYTDKSSTELGLMQIKDGNLVSRYTTPKDFLPLGAMSL